MGYVWFCCWDANRVRYRLRLCRSSKDPSLQFRDTRSRMSCLLDHWYCPYFLFSVIVVTHSMFHPQLLKYLFSIQSIQYGKALFSQFSFYARVEVFLLVIFLVTVLVSLFILILHLDPVTRYWLSCCFSSEQVAANCWRLLHHITFESYSLNAHWCFSTREKMKWEVKKKRKRKYLAQ